MVFHTPGFFKAPASCRPVATLRIERTPRVMENNSALHGTKDGRVSGLSVDRLRNQRIDSNVEIPIMIFHWNIVDLCDFARESVEHQSMPIPSVNLKRRRIRRSVVIQLCGEYDIGIAIGIHI